MTPPKAGIEREEEAMGEETVITSLLVFCPVAFSTMMLRMEVFFIIMQ